MDNLSFEICWSQEGKLAYVSCGARQLYLKENEDGDYYFDVYKDDELWECGPDYDLDEALTDKQKGVAKELKRRSKELAIVIEAAIELGVKLAT